MTVSSTVGRISQLDTATLAKLQAGCNFINAEVSRVRGRIMIVAAVVAVLGVIVYGMMWNNGARDPRFVIGAALALIIGFAAWEHRKLSKTYKQIVVRRVVSALGQGLTYSPDSRFTKQDFLAMDLFNLRVEQWRAEDEVGGRRNAVTYSILEAKATRTEGSGKNRRTITIFKGVIVRLDFNKHFHGHTIVVPNSESQILGGLFGESSSRRSKELCRMENVEFEDAYSVYSTDQQEARYILTPKLMDLIMRARQRLNDGLRVSFHDNSVFVTLPDGGDRFELKLFGAKITPESTVGELCQVVQLAEDLVEALDLETRIWTRV